MKLTDDEKAMLDGTEGAAVQKAMDMLVQYGEALGAEKMIDTQNVAGYLIADLKSMRQHRSFDALFSERNLDTDIAIEFPKVKVSSCQIETSLDPDYFELLGKTVEDRDLYLENMTYLSKLNVQLICSCAPYQVGNVPVKGEHCAWMESSAVIYINSVLGARTNCEGRESATSAMLTGKIPYWGYHIPENRVGTHLIKVDCEIETMMDWGLLGYYSGKIVQEEVPVITGVKKTSHRDKLKHFGAAAASAGGVEMYHIPGLTAEAETEEDAFQNKKPVEVIKYGIEEKIHAYELLNSIGQNTDVDFVMLGCPHYSIDQLWYLCGLLEGKKIKNGVNFWIFVPYALKKIADRNGFTKIIESSGAILMKDTCPALGKFKPKGAKVMATDSAKQAHYLPNLTGIEAWYGSTEDCVNAALTGKWRGEFR